MSKMIRILMLLDGNYLKKMMVILYSATVFKDLYSLLVHRSMI
jgi:hypothetical protein